MIGELAWIEKETYAIWRCYPKWELERIWDSFIMKNDGWEYDIYKDIKGEITMARISNSAQDALKKHGYFFLHHQHYSYIKIHRSVIQSYQFPRFMSNRLLLIDMMR